MVISDLPPRLAYCVGRLKWDLHAACYTPKTGGKLFKFELESFCKKLFSSFVIKFDNKT